MEKHFAKRSLAEFRAERDRAQPWKERFYEERLIAMAVICGTQETYGQDQSRFSRVYQITRRKQR